MFGTIFDTLGIGGMRQKARHHQNDGSKKNRSYYSQIPRLHGSWL